MSLHLLKELAHSFSLFCSISISTTCLYVLFLRCGPPAIHSFHLLPSPPSILTTSTPPPHLITNYSYFPRPHIVAYRTQSLLAAYYCSLSRSRTLSSLCPHPFRTSKRSCCRIEPRECNQFAGTDEETYIHTVDGLVDTVLNCTVQ